MPGRIPIGASPLLVDVTSPDRTRFDDALEKKKQHQQEEGRGTKGKEIFFVAGIILYLQVVGCVLFVATPDDLRIFVATPLIRFSEIVSYVFYPIVVSAFLRLLVSEPPQEEWAAAWGAALLINMVNGAWLLIASADDNRTFANFSTGVWACAFCLAATTIWKLVNGMALRVSQAVSVRWLAVGCSMLIILMVFGAGVLLASSHEERAVCFAVGVKCLAGTSCLVFLIWLWQLIKHVLMDKRMLALISVVVVIIMCTLAGLRLGSTKEEQVSCAWIGIFAFGTYCGIVLLARMVRFVSAIFVSPPQLAALACIVSINMVFGSVLSLASSKEEQLYALSAYLWTYAFVAVAACAVWLVMLLRDMFQDEKRVTALALVVVINMTSGASWSIASNQRERIACLWVGVLALCTCAIVAVVFWLYGLIDAVLEDNPTIWDTEQNSQIGKMMESLDGGGQVRARVRRASLMAGRRLSELLSPVTDALTRVQSETGFESPVRRVRRMSAVNQQKDEEELARMFSDFLKREDTLDDDEEETDFGRRAFADREAGDDEDTESPFFKGKVASAAQSVESWIRLPSSPGKESSFAARLANVSP